jgi:mono/diheme cytochrome c family protein
VFFAEVFEMKRRAFASLVMLSLGVASASAAETIDFARQIEPIFNERCAKCHGEAKAQAKLRLDSIAGIEEKLQAKPQLLVAGKPDESLLYQRLVLPADSPKRMPKGGDPLPKEKLDLIAEWIKQGAVLKAALASAEVEKPTQPPAAKPVAKPAEKPALPEVAAAPQPAVDKLVAAGARVTPLFAGSNLLEISFAPRGEPVGDPDVALLADVAEQVYALNLADAKISAAGLAPLAGMKHLARLHLERAAIDDGALAHVNGLGQLEYLNLYGTSITDAGLKHLSGLPRLVKLYLWQTKVSYDAAMSLEKEIPGLIVNLGFDHPVVARKRLTKELEDAKKQVDAAKADVTKIEQQLERSKKDAEASAARVTEIEKDLKALDAPADGSGS